MRSCRGSLCGGGCPEAAPALPPAAQVEVHAFTQAVQHSGLEGLTLHFELGESYLAIGACSQGHPRCCAVMSWHCTATRACLAPAHPPPPPAPQTPHPKPAVPYLDHFTVEGMNGFYLSGAANCWVRNVRPRAQRIATVHISWLFSQVLSAPWRRRGKLLGTCPPAPSTAGVSGCVILPVPGRRISSTPTRAARPSTPTSRSCRASAWASLAGGGPGHATR